jgi:hypothetical protein
LVSMTTTVLASGLAVVAAWLGGAAGSGPDGE